MIDFPLLQLLVAPIRQAQGWALLSPRTKCGDYDSVLLARAYVHICIYGITCMCNGGGV